MAFATKGQTKATAAFKGNFSVYGQILFKVWIKVAYWPTLTIHYMAFRIKGQTKAAAAFKVHISACLFFRCFSGTFGVILKI